MFQGGVLQRVNRGAILLGRNEWAIGTVQWVNITFGVTLIKKDMETCNILYQAYNYKVLSSGYGFEW